MSGLNEKSSPVEVWRPNRNCFDLKSVLADVLSSHKQKGLLMSAAARQQLRIRVQLLDDNNAPSGFPITIVGREYWTLRKLIDAGDVGVSSLENVGPRVSHYVFKLRGYGFAIETVNEKHGGAYPGHHARYRLLSKLLVLEEAGKLAA